MVGNLAEIRKKSIGPSWEENDKREKVMLMMRDSDGFDTCSGVENIWVEPGEAQSLLCRVQRGAGHHDLGDAWVSRDRSD